MCQTNKNLYSLSAKVSSWQKQFGSNGEMGNTGKDFVDLFQLNGIMEW